VNGLRFLPGRSIGSIATTLPAGVKSVFVAKGRCCIHPRLQPVRHPRLPTAALTLGWNTNSPTAAEARQKALAGCRDVKNSTDAARSLCTIVGTFHNQCVAGAEDPDAGTPGVGWAVAADKKTAEQQALAMCQAKSPPARRAACKVMTSGCDGSAK